MRISKTTITSFATVFGAIGIAANTAFAAEQCDANTPAIAAISNAAEPRTSDPLFGAPLANARLETQRGGQDLIVNEQKLKATLTDNSASNLNTGNNIITDGALAGINGIPMVIQNSGNNVIIQNSTILNLNLK